MSGDQKSDKSVKILHDLIDAIVPRIARLISKCLDRFIDAFDRAHDVTIILIVVHVCAFLFFNFAGSDVSVLDGGRVGSWATVAFAAVVLSGIGLVLGHATGKVLDLLGDVDQSADRTLVTTKNREPNSVIQVSTPNALVPETISFALFGVSDSESAILATFLNRFLNDYEFRTFQQTHEIRRLDFKSGCVVSTEFMETNTEHKYILDTKTKEVKHVQNSSASKGSAGDADDRTLVEPKGVGPSQELAILNKYIQQIHSREG